MSERNIFAVCDLDVDYAYHFMEYLSKKKNIPFEVRVFTSAAGFQEYVKEHPVELLLISEKAMNSEIREAKIGQILILSDGVVSKGYEEYPSIYKYQSSNQVIREALEHYGEGVGTTAQQLRQGAEWSDEEILERIDLLVSETARENRLTVKQREEIRRELFYSVRKLDILQELLDDDRVTEIMVNGYQNIFVEREGKKSRWEKSFVSKEKLEDVVQQIAGKCNRVINENSPIVDARLENGSRVNAVIYPVALDGPILTIRRFPEHAITMEDLIAKESITREAATFLEQMVKAGYSILIGGGTSSGKTTFLNALSNAIPHEERIITIEDSAELQIQGVENLVRLEAKPANMEGNRAITIRDLIRTALRMAPNRIIVGEIRGEEAVDLLQAFICTI